MRFIFAKFLRIFFSIILYELVKVGLIVFNLDKDMTRYHTVKSFVSLNLNGLIPSDLVFCVLLKAPLSGQYKGTGPIRTTPLAVYYSAMYTRYLCQQSIEENQPFSCILLVMMMIYSCCISCSWHVSEFFLHIYL